VLALLKVSASAGAAESVTTTSDSGGGSLRQAILNANASGGGDIVFATNVSGTITLLSPLPCLTNVTITGPGTNLLTVSGNDQFQVFRMNSGTTNSLSGLTIADGSLPSNFNAPMTYGCGISNAGSLKLANCAIRGCIFHEEATGGGGIYNGGDLLMKNCVVADCLDSAPMGSGPGGGIYNAGDLRMEDCTVSGCRARGGGGIANGGNLLLTNCIIESCSSYVQADGGGIENSGSLTAYSCTISNCYASWTGGGICGGGSVALTNCTLINNGANHYGGGFGAENDYGPQFNVIMNGCTIADNYCWEEFGGGIGGYGFNVTLLDCTVSQNEVAQGYGGARGGGIEVRLGGVSLNHCTIVSNTVYLNPWYYGSALGPGGGVYGVVQSQNSIFAGNGSNDIYGTVISEGYNLIQNTNGCTITNNQTGNVYGADPQVGPLQDNGGPTWTHALLPGSPAIDQGSSGGLATDQRGVNRPYDVPGISNAADGSDIGAYEWTRPPTASNLVAAARQNQPLSIPVQKLLLCGSHPDGRPLSLGSLGANSTNGGTVVVAGDMVIYTPMTDFVGPDRFTYALTDGWGGTATADVVVSVALDDTASQNMLTPLCTPGGLLVRFAGIVGRTYSVQRALAVSGPWVTVGTVTVGPTGIGSFEDTDPPPGSALYRTAYP